MQEREVRHEPFGGEARAIGVDVVDAGQLQEARAQ